MAVRGPLDLRPSVFARRQHAMSQIGIQIVSMPVITGKQAAVGSKAGILRDMAATKVIGTHDHRQCFHRFRDASRYSIARSLGSANRAYP